MEEVRERSLTDLVAEIMRDLQRLVRDEVRLARTEISESIADVATGVAALGVAAVMAFLGVAFIGVAAFFALLLALPGWASGLLVAAGFFILAAIAFFVGRSQLKMSRLRPEQTIRSLEEDREWLESRLR
ncbi:MAG: phage holin family protein [Anaerolineae bacterium]|nr:phage holin family protein [Anaerolineae bacterium]